MAAELLRELDRSHRPTKSARAAHFCRLHRTALLALSIGALVGAFVQSCLAPLCPPGAACIYGAPGVQPYVEYSEVASFWAVYDVQRQVLLDSWMSSVIVGRSVATVAELCFAAQWALLLRSVAQSCNSRGIVRVSYWIVPMILVAETCSWYAVLTTSNLGHVIEESLWGFSAAMLVASLVYLWPRADRALRPLLLVASVLGLAYVFYMLHIDVPMYWSRWVQDEGQGRQYLGLMQGAIDASSRWVVSHRWEDWKSEVIWMSLYFSVAVWLSIGLMHAAHGVGQRNTLQTTMEATQ